MESNMTEEILSLPETQETLPPATGAVGADDSAVEALIFSSPEPLVPSRIVELVNTLSPREIEKIVTRLNTRYEEGGHAFRIRKVGGGYQYHILPPASEFVHRLYRRERKLRLTKPALETMAIVAYKQPVSKVAIEQIRGVASDSALSTLLERNFVRIAGRADTAGRPLLYSATDEFLRFFGIDSFNDLPKLTEIDELLAAMESERAARRAEELADRSGAIPTPDTSDIFAM